MKRYRRIHNKWKKREVKFLSKYEINIEEGYDSFDIEEDEKYVELKKENFGIQKSLFNKKNYLYDSIIGVKFSKEELDASEYYALNNLGSPKGYPQPKVGYEKNTYRGVCDKCGVYKEQISPFRIKNEPKFGKNQVHFSLNWIFDETFIKKDFFQEVLAPLGLKSKDVLIHKTGKPSETVVQLDIPTAKSRLLLDESPYDTQKPCTVCGTKKYDQRNLDFIPPFANDFDFIICKTQESFGETETHQANRRVIISKEFCELLVNHKVIKYNTYNLTPFKS